MADFFAFASMGRQESNMANKPKPAASTMTAKTATSEKQEQKEKEKRKPGKKIVSPQVYIKAPLFHFSFTP